MGIKQRAGLLTGLFCILAGTFAAFSYLDSAYNTESAGNVVVETESGNIYIKAAGYEIALWQKGNLNYAFLPSACKGMHIELEIPEGTDPDSIVWMHSENIPAVFIDTESGSTEQIHADKNVKETGEVSVLGADGVTSFRMPLSYIKSRGNTSFTSFEKKSYQIKLSDSVSFLGMDAAKKWIFISNAPDATLLRNALTRNLAGRLELAQSDEGVFVDLYLNGEYKGNYYVTEKVEVKKNRVPITDLEKATEIANGNEDLSSYETAWTDTTKAKQIPSDPGDITGGYLIERDFEKRFLSEVEINSSYFITEAKETFIVRSPEYVSENQIAYINNYIQSVENAILSHDGIDPGSGKSYQELVDVKSFARKYLLEEVASNYDGGVASSYFYKDRDCVSEKLFAGPIWDYDVTWGNAPSYLGYLSRSPERLTRLEAHEDSSVWFTALYEKADFHQEMCSCYQEEISPYLPVLALQVLPQLEKATAASAAMDRIRWENQYAENEAFDSREEEIAFLTEYILMRKAFLDKAWIEQVPVYQIELLIENTPHDTLYVFEGESLPELTDPELSYAEFIGWTSEKDGLPPDQNTLVYEDMVFHGTVQYP
ncbi:MAG: CotH kinase family protein [Lachnospiraceae bacterium]|nr:CotH kinase family protein [Lachnospiraceae bacterium]